MTTVHPISVAPDFCNPPASIHALRYSRQQRGGSATLRASREGPSSSKIQIAFSNSEDGDTEYAGTMVDAGSNECVLLWDDETKSYTLHRLATSSSLAASHEGGLSKANHGETGTRQDGRGTNGASTSRTPNNAHPLSPVQTSRPSTYHHAVNGATPHGPLHHLSSPSPSPSPRISSSSRMPDPVTHGLGINNIAPRHGSSHLRPEADSQRSTVGRKGVLGSSASNTPNLPSSPTFANSRQVEHLHSAMSPGRDDDLASPSEGDENGDDEDDDDMEEIPVQELPPARAPVPLPQAPTASNGIVVSDDEDDSESEGEEDFDDAFEKELQATFEKQDSATVTTTQQLASTRNGARPAPQGSSQGMQRNQTAGKKMPSNKAMVDSDIASSSEESGDDSD